MSSLRSLLSQRLESPFYNPRRSGQVGWVEDLGGWFRDAFSSLWDSISALADTFWTFVLDTVGPVVQWFSDTYNAIVLWLSDAVNAVVDWVSAQYQTVATWIRTTAQAIWSWVSTAVVDSFNFTLAFVTSFSDWSAQIIDDATTWVVESSGAAFAAGFDLMGDVLLDVLALGLGVASWVISAIPVPEFIANNSIGGLLGSAGPTVGWMANSLRLPEALALLAAGVAFRLLRKLLTLGQW